MRYLSLLLLFFPAGVALAQDPAAPPAQIAEYLLGLGPIGALVYGAFLLGKGVNISLVHKVELSEADRDILERAFASRDPDRSASRLRPIRDAAVPR